jgi:hypothetical protein
MNQTALNFDGATFNPVLDGRRLGDQLAAVKELMLDGNWRTLAQIKDVLGHPETSISARLRDLRKDRFGGLQVYRRRIPGTNGLHEYKVTR